MNTLKMWEKLIKIADFFGEIVLHCVPAHIGIIGNEIADGKAKSVSQTFSSQTLDEVCAFAHRYLI